MAIAVLHVVQIGEAPVIHLHCEIHSLKIHTQMSYIICHTRHSFWRVAYLDSLGSKVFKKYATRCSSPSTSNWLRTDPMLTLWHLTARQNNDQSLVLAVQHRGQVSFSCSKASHSVSPQRTLSVASFLVRSLSGPAMEEMTKMNCKY